MAKVICAGCGETAPVWVGKDDDKTCRNCGSSKFNIIDHRH